ncbi:MULTISPECIES: ABC transporter ATP-binding protein [unclassified Rhizobium]|uniref:ABC transporter ATP-binding protein n=1 Tax=unclassified Rhizobium TaxID=2613769 RepID=UPI001ADAE89D|nr:MULTISPECIES: ABC transporter ATP-binding protein [unclassified Rhizobium]MBO9099058.1 ABC transporter ATP-binding protein [Rhizobium sp. L58/93]MBO9132135.1 ABC transporter ATP-binding protein [Rhizobium sp. B209b/85]MBO9169321.1 ABC transporter ATP-binding protein [Rhizobium sp. L245/93]MBO9185273.1 ABC transporter ATP-binding protein [Rhizobium sp. E27B/91]QXZ85416.1 ABC transporter ATP-binding protein [Rhizobium sp. K1/93]
MLIRTVVRLFETWLDPFYRNDELRPPQSLYAFIWYYVRQAKGPFLAMAVLGGAVAMLEAALFWFVGHLVDILDTVPKGDGWHGLLSGHGWSLLGMVFVVLVVRFIVVSLGALVEEQVVVPGFLNLVRWQAYVHVARQSLSFFQNDFSGRIVTKVWSAGQSTGDLVVSLLQVVWFIIIYAASTVALVGGLDWRLALIVAVWIGLFCLLARFFVPRIRRHARDAAEASSMLNGRMVDAYANIQTLKLFGREDRNDLYIRDGFDRFQAAVMPFTRLLTGVRSSLALLSGVMITSIAAFAIQLWLSGAITTGGVAFTLSMVLRLNMLFGRMMTQFNSIMRNLGTIQNAAEMISQPIGLVDRPDAKALVVSRPEIRFEKVRFHYGRGSGVIDDFSLVIKPGEKVGIVGRSGAGKTTLVNLLLRFYDLEAGSILIDGQDISRVTQESLRAAIGMVTQDTALLNRSIRDNILFGRPDAGADLLLQATSRAEADTFIADLEDQNGRKGFSAHVGERGVKLSGGQRQRISIARVMLKDAPILVLDEATSALDSEVEAALQSNLLAMMEGKTVLAIAHRLSTIAALDRLVVIEKGRIIEDGSHAELLSRNGLYSELWARQSGGFIAVDAE